MGYAEAQQRAGAKAQKADINTGLNFQLPGMVENQRRELRNISLGMEERGLARSGETLRRRSESSYDALRAQQALKLQASQQLGGIDRTLSAQLGQNAIERANQANASAEREAYRAAQDRAIADAKKRASAGGGYALP